MPEKIQRKSNVAKLLIPAKPRRGPRLPLTLATFLVPLIGLFVILNIAPVRSPLVESEASLALAVRHLSDHPASSMIAQGPLTTAGIALAAMGRSIVGSNEFQLRILGLLAGVAAMSVLLRLGERLYSTRVGILAVILLFATSSGRALLGAQLSVAPFYLLTSFLALRAIRVLAVSRLAGVYAGMAIGASFALVGYPALWLLLFTAIWLQRLRGLTFRNTMMLMAVTLISAAILSLLSVGILVAHGSQLQDALAMGIGGFPAAQDPVSFLLGLLVFLPLLPVVALGIAFRPADWQWQGSPRFIGIWLFCSLLEVIFTGQWSSLFVGLCVSIAVPCIWAIENVSRKNAFFALGVSVSILLVVLALSPGEIARRSHESWAARETGRFTRRLVPIDMPIRTTENVRHRIAYYGRRQTLPPVIADPTQTPYILLERTSLSQMARDVPLPRELILEGTPTRIVAEIGPYVIGKQSTGAAADEEGEPAPPGGLDRRATFWQSR
ncbi:MAG TPA: hypothetical protein DCG06_16500 [Deltaproteobacteria bacterium]|nr:hypothetical protein [Deltaproteobacteria bacterium]